MSHVDALFDGRVVTAWVIVAETIDTDGERRLECIHADATGVALGWWNVEGLLSAALQTYQAVSPVATRDDDEDDDD